MRESRRNNLLLAVALLLIAGTAAIYIALMRAWLSEKPAPAARRAAPLLDLAGLPPARAQFRDRFVDPNAHLRLAEALRRAGRPVDAFYAAHAARALFGDEAFRRAHEFVVLYQGSHYLNGQPYDPSPQNRAKLEERLKADPLNPLLLQYLARLAEERGEGTEARRLVESGLAAGSRDRGLQLLRARLAAPTDAFAAIGHYARLAHAEPDSEEGRQAFAALESFAREREEGALGEAARLSREALEELARALPEHARPLGSLGRAYRARGDLNAARALAAESLAKRPDHPGANMIEGLFALDDRLYDTAIKRFTAAWEADPEDLESAARLAGIYHHQRGQLEAALPFYLALHRRDPWREEGEPVERIIRTALDSRREQLLKDAPAELLGRHLGSEDASIRAQACVRAAELKDARWIETLAELLDDDTEIVRHNADYALYRIAQEHPDAVRVRRDEWLANNRPLLRARVLNLFADLWPQETFPLVSRLLYDDHPAVRFFTKAMVLDRYYKDLPAAKKLSAQYLPQEKHPGVLALYERLKGSRAP